MQLKKKKNRCCLLLFPRCLSTHGYVFVFVCPSVLLDVGRAALWRLLWLFVLRRLISNRCIILCKSSTVSLYIQSKYVHVVIFVLLLCALLGVLKWSGEGCLWRVFVMCCWWRPVGIKVLLFWDGATGWGGKTRRTEEKYELKKEAVPKKVGMHGRKKHKFTQSFSYLSSLTTSDEISLKTNKVRFSENEKRINKSAEHYVI